MGGSQAGGKGPQSTAPATKFAPHATSRSTKHFACHDFWKRTTCPKVTIHSNSLTCHEIRACLRPPYPKHCACHKYVYTSTSTCSDFPRLSRKADFSPPQHEASLAPATKGDHQVQKCARHHKESAPPSSAIPRAAIRATWRREIAFGDLRTELFCEPAQPKRPAQRVCPDRTRAFTLTVRTPQCGHTVWGTMK